MHSRVEKTVAPYVWCLVCLLVSTGCSPDQQVSGDAWHVNGVRDSGNEMSSGEVGRDASVDVVQRNACGAEIRTNTEFVKEQDGIWTRHFPPFQSDCAQYQLSLSFDETGEHPHFHYEYSVCNICEDARKLETGKIHNEEDLVVWPLREDEMIASLVIRDSAGRQFAAPCDAFRRYSLESMPERHLSMVQRAVIEPREELRTRRSLFIGEFILLDTEGRQKTGTYRPVDLFDPALEAYIVWAPVSVNSPEVERPSVFDPVAICDDVVGFDLPFHFQSDLASFPTQSLGQIELPEAFLEYAR